MLESFGTASGCTPDVMAGFSRSGAVAPASDVVKHAPTLSDIKPITPAPRTIPEHEKTASAMDDSMSTIPHITGPIPQSRHSAVSADWPDPPR